MNKLSKRQYIFLIIAIIWMAVIFYFSALPAEKSEKESGLVATFLCAIFVDGFDEMSLEEQLSYTDAIDYPIRKVAHATEYAILGFLLAGVCIADINGYKRWLQFLAPWLATVIYAATDEFHQLFVEGRSGQVTDVCIDALGGAVGVIVMIEMLKFYNNKNLEDKSA